MKKIYTLLFALLTVVSANAYYLRGGFNNWGTTELTDNGDGTYSATLESLSGEFKVDQNGDWATNWGSNGQAIALDQPYVCTAGGDNIKFANTAAIYNNVTVTFTPATLTLLISGEAGGQIEYTSWTICGTGTLLGADWSTTETANDMIEQADGSWRLEKNNVTLTAGNYDYKVVANHAWSIYEIPASGNQTLTIAANGIYNVVFTMDADHTALTAEATLVGGETTTTLYYLGASFNDWTATASPFDGNTITVELQAGTHEFKVVTNAGTANEAWLGYDDIINSECTSEGVSKNIEWGNIVVVLTAAGSITVTIGEDGHACVTYTQGEPEPIVRETFTYHAGATAEADPAFILMTSLVEGATDENANPQETIVMTKGENDIYTAEVNVETKSIYIVRCSTGSETIQWGGNVWNGTTWIPYAQEYWFAGWNAENNWIFDLTTEEPIVTGINHISSTAASKMLQNGQLIIIREGQKYNINGSILK